MLSYLDNIKHMLHKWKWNFVSKTFKILSD